MNVLSAVVRFLRIAHLRFVISSDEAWIKACEREGIFDTNEVRRISREVEALRVELALLQAR